jgi:hypothetical protein
MERTTPNNLKEFPMRRMPQSLVEAREIAARHFAVDKAAVEIEITVAFGDVTMSVWVDRNGDCRTESKYR